MSLDPRPNTRSWSRTTCDSNSSSDNRKNNETSNFLSGFKLSVIDVLSIPDPPSPVDEAQDSNWKQSRKHKMRRRSSPVVMAESTANCERGKNSEEYNNRRTLRDTTNKTLPRGSTKNARGGRKSLSVIPSPDFHLSDSSSITEEIIKPDNKQKRSKNANNSKPPTARRERRSLAALPSPECLLLSDSSPCVVENTSTKTATSRATRKTKRRMSSINGGSKLNEDDDDTEIVRNDIKHLFDDEDDDETVTTNEVVPITKRHRSTKTPPSSLLPPRSKPPKIATSKHDSVGLHTKSCYSNVTSNEVMKNSFKCNSDMESNNEGNLNNNPSYNSNSNSNSNNNQMDIIKQHIRQLCAFTNKPSSSSSTNNRSINVTQLAQNIHSMTGYKPYVPIYLIHNYNKDKQSKTQSKRDLLTKYGPIVNQLSTHQQKTEAQFQRLTGCTVEKMKGGLYVYRNIDTKELVDVEMYKDLYMNAVTANKNDVVVDCSSSGSSNSEGKTTISSSSGIATKEESATNYEINQLHKKVLKSNGISSSCSIKEDNCTTLLSTSSTSSSYSTSTSTTNRIFKGKSNETESFHQPPSNNISISKKSKAIKENHNASSLLLSESVSSTTASLFSSSSHNANSYLEKSSNENSSKIISHYHLRHHHNETETKTISTGIAKDKGTNDSKTENSVFKFPNRHQLSSDPDIAAAEKTLWSSIDLALAKYSNEVMTIEERKKLLLLKNVIQE